MSDEFTPPPEPTAPEAPQWQTYARMYPEGGSGQSSEQLDPAAADESGGSGQTYAQLYPAAASEGDTSWQTYARMYPAAAGESPAYGAPASAAPAQPEPAPGDVVSAGPRPSGKRGLLVGVGALALTLLAGGGIYIASQSDSEAGGDPESVVPATAFAFAKIDLDPATDQKVAIHEFSKKFPKGPQTTSTDPMDGLLTEVFKDETGRCTYAADIKPWLGKQIAVAAVEGAGGKTVPLIAIEVTDEAAAKAALTKTTTTGECAGDADSGDLKGFAVKDGYGLLSNTQADVDAAVKSAGERTLSAADNFTSDIGKLDGNQVVVMWADLGRAYSAIAAETPQLGALPPALSQQMKGRVVLGVHMENDVAEFSGRTLGGDLSTVTTGTAETLKGLPEKTVMALTAAGLQKQLETQLDSLRASGMPVDDMLAQAATQFGVDVRKDLLPLFGSSTTLALGNIPTSPLDVKFGMKNLVDDPAAAEATGKKIAEIAKSAGIHLDAEVDGSTLYLATGGYAAELRAPGTLGQTPAFQKAMGELGDAVTGAFYLDISQIAALRGSGADADDLAHLSAFGLSGGKDGSDGYFRMRLVVK